MMNRHSLLLLGTCFAISSGAVAQTVAPVAVVKPNTNTKCAACLPCACQKAFQGFFLGGNIGYGVGFANVRDSASGGEVFGKNNIGYRGVDGGINVGYQYRLTNVAVGLEGVFNWANATGTAQTTIGGSAVNNYIKQKNDIQVRVPISYVVCNLVAPKILLGWDNARINKSSRGAVDLNKRYNGFLWGMGLDALMAEHILAGIEYTGVIYGEKKTVDSDGDSTKIAPQYNKFALTLKYLF